jgi:hypothetical protein
MSRLHAALLPAALLLGAIALPAEAASSAGSSISDSVSTSVGSISGSIEKSSNSSSKTTKLAQGDYRVVEVLAVADQPEKLRLHLQAVADASADGEFYLTLPAAAVAAGAIAEGQIVSAKSRVYGLEFAAAQTGEAFFLVLEDSWKRELQTRPVLL